MFISYLSPIFDLAVAKNNGIILNGTGICDLG